MTIWIVKGDHLSGSLQSIEERHGNYLLVWVVALVDQLARGGRTPLEEASNGRAERLTTSAMLMSSLLA